MPTFIPSAAVNVKIKFDETLLLQPETNPVSNAAAVQAPATVSTPSPQPLIVESGRGQESFLMCRVPSKLTVEMPGYRVAGTFSCEFMFKDLPIDPRTVRSAAVEIYMGAVETSAFARGMAGPDSNGQRSSVISTRDAAGQVDLSTLQMVAIVDEWDVHHSDTSSVVSMKGRDLRGPLIDTPVSTVPNSNKQIINELDWGQPIDVLVTQLLAFRPEFADYRVKVLPSEWPDGVPLSPAADGLVPRHRRGANGQRAGGRGTTNSGSKDLSFWDLITRACYLVGAIPYFHGFELYIRPSRNLFTQQNAGDDPMRPTPFYAGRSRLIDFVSETLLPEPLRVRKMVYGRDIEDINFTRTFGGYQRPRVIRCTSVDNSSRARGPGRVIEARWPAETASVRARRTRVSPGGDASSEEIVDVPCPGFTDVTRLQFVAQALYEEMGRNELGGSCSTKNLASFGGDNRDPDLLRLKVGDAIEFDVDRRFLDTSPPLVSTLTDFNRDSFEEAVAKVEARIGTNTGGNRNLARVLVATARGSIHKIQKFFRVANIRYAWDAASGVKIDFDFQNYFVPDLENLSTAAGATSTTSVPGHGTRRRSAPINVYNNEEIIENFPLVLEENSITNYPDTSNVAGSDMTNLPIFQPRRGGT